MDLLDDVLATLDLRGALYFRTDCTGPWGVTVPDLRNAARFHYVVEGRLHVGFPSGAAVDLAAGDLVLVPGGRSHVLADRPGRAAPPLETVLERAGYDGRGVVVLGDGDAGAATRAICGHLSFRDGGDHPLIRALPERVVVTGALRAAQPFLDDLLRIVAQRLFSSEIGSVAAATRLSEVVFVELLRVGLDASPDAAAVLAAFRDRQIGRALELIHAAPDAPWTVQRLAAEVGMSRSRFAERFQAMTGAAPIAYLADWRLQKALALLDGGRQSVQQVAASTGYRSPAAFTRAFVARFGTAPSQWRRAGARGRQEPAPAAI